MEKKQIDAAVEAKTKETKEFEIVMRSKASTVGNIVGKNVPVSQTEVGCFFFSTIIFFPPQALFLFHRIGR